MSLIETLFEALNRGDVRYVVVGGGAAVLHGHARLTVDVDLVVDLAPAPDLIAMKRSAGRLQDLADVEALEATLAKRTAELNDDWQADWEGHRQWQLSAALAATPAQRLAWLEEMIELAYRAKKARSSETEGL